MFIQKLGATSVGAVGGLLTALVSPALGPFTFFFAFLFGVYVDASLFILKVNASSRGVNRNRLILAVGLATLLIAVSSYSAFAIFPEYISASGVLFVSLFVQRSRMLDALVIFMGPVTGGVAGYSASYLWNKYLRHISV